MRIEVSNFTGDPQIISQPIVALVADTIWAGIIFRQFVYSRLWNMFSLLIFICSQKIFMDMSRTNFPESKVLLYVVFFGRMFNYIVGMGRMALFHISRIWTWSRNTMRRIIEEIDTDGNGTIDAEEFVEALQRFKDTVKEEFYKAVKVLRDDEGPTTADESRKSIATKDKTLYNMVSLTLLVLLAIMCIQEPMLWCVGDPDWPTDVCPNSASLLYRYSIFSMIGMAVHLLILIDLAVFNTEISAFLLVCGHVLAEVKQFLMALGFLLLAFGSGISILCRNCPTDGCDFSNMSSAMVTLFAITVGLYQGDYRDVYSNHMLVLLIFVFLTFSAVLLMNLLIAQLNRSYEYIYRDMLGFARLGRASLIVEAMQNCSKKKWAAFAESKHFERCLEFDEGDLGLPGGIATSEPSNLHRCTTEQVKRYGGSTSPDTPWPEERSRAELDEEERFEKIETIIQKTLRRIAKFDEASKQRPAGGPAIQSSDFSSGSDLSVA